MPGKSDTSKADGSAVTVAVLGYGSQGRAVALNLHDSGYDVVVGLPSRSASRPKAGSDGITSVATVIQAVKRADIVCFALPDHRHRQVFEQEIEPNLRPGRTLWFLHGLSIHFGLVKAPGDCDIILVAPHAPGVSVREEYLGDQSLSAFWAVHQDHSGTAEETALKLARALGFATRRLVETTFEHEAVGDLFGEQAVLCGGMAGLIKNGFDILVENGLPPDNAYLEVAFQLDLIIRLIKQHGIEGMYERISVAAQLGSFQTGPEVIGPAARKAMEQAYRQIASGEFARLLDELDESTLKQLKEARARQTSPDFERAARKFRR